MSRQRPSTKRGLFITFEGPEGSGKSSQAKRLASRLRRAHRRVILLSDPGSTSLGRRLRQVLLQDRALKCSPLAEAMVFIAARAQLVHEKIIPALRKNQVVICDRFHDSTIAYQAFGANLRQKSWLDNVGKFAISQVMPDLTFLIDVPVATGFARITRMKDRMESKNRKFHERVRRGYRKLAKTFPARFVVLDGTQTEEALAYDIRSVVEKRLGLFLG